MRKNQYVSTVLAVLAATLFVPTQASAQTPIAGDCFSDDFLPIVGDDQVFDLTVSLYGHPTTAERTQYETVLRHFARGIFEMSNGQHKIRTITIHQDGYQKRFSDIIWARGGGASPPAAVSHMGGFLDALGKIYFYDIQQDTNAADFPYVDLVRGNADQQRLSGYDLAHEFGHYAYSLGDEYRGFQSPDYPQVVSVMSVVQNTVKTGQSDNLQWLNFSTSSSLHWAAESSNVTQGRTWGLPSWGLLTQACQSRQRNTATGVLIADDGTEKYLSHYPKSIFYTRLGSVAPSSTNTWLNPNDNVTYPTMKPDLANNPGASDPLEHFNVVWLDSSNVEMELILDVSGSMSGQPIQNVINAAKTFASQVPLGRTTLGVTTFESVVNTGLVPLRPIAQASDVTAVQNQISTIAVGDDTAMFLGAKQGLQKLEDYRTAHGTNASRVVFLLSDGNDNASGGVTESDVTTAYKAAKVRMHTLGFADRDMSENFFPPLERMAAATGGIFHRSITQVADLNEAMRIALGDALSVQDIKLSGLGDPFPIDTFYSQLDFDIDYSLNPGGGVTFDVVDSFGAPAAHQVFVSPRPDGTFTATLIVSEDAITAGGIGKWQLIPQFTGAGATITSQRLHAIPGTKAPLDLIVAASHRQTYSYPEPIEVYARTVLDGDITGLAMSAELVAPSGATRQISLVDDGTGNDAAAADGLYSAQIADYTEDGSYTLKVAAVNDGTAVAIQPAAEPGFGGVPVAPRFLPLTTKFSRETQITIGVSGVRPDDHGNSPGAATVILPDYAPHFGKIEATGDQDVFEVVNIDPALGLNVRVFNAAFGMVPKVTVYASDGQSVIAFGNPFVAATSNGYISLSIPQASLGTRIFFAVEDLNGKAGGTYTVDVGPPVASDTLAVPMLKVESRDTRVNESNVSGIETRITNRGGHAISDFKVVYYFETEFFQTPVLEDWWSGASTPRLVQRGLEQYAVEFDYSGLTLAPGGSLPFDSENSVGLHYADWSPWNRTNDFSNNGSTTFAENPKIAVFDREGRLIFGQTPPVHAPRAPVVDVRAQSREDKLSDSQWTSPDVFVENRGDDISNFVVYYYFNTENGKLPVLADWDSTTSNVTLEHVSGTRYRIKYDYDGFTLRHTTSTPFPSRTLVGVHYPDWSAMNLVNDPSNNRSSTYLVNDRIQIFDRHGNRIWGLASP